MGKRIDNKGYIRIYAPQHPRADKRGMVYEHILVTEKKLNRSLLFGEVVHHIDRNRQNNNPENLITFPNNFKHLNYHQRLQNYLY